MHGILAQLGEHLPYKQRVTGSSPVGPTSYYLIRNLTEYADVAQLAEQLICNQQVIGSSPIIGFGEMKLFYEQRKTSISKASFLDTICRQMCACINKQIFPSELEKFACLHMLRFTSLYG